MYCRLYKHCSTFLFFAIRCFTGASKNFTHLNYINCWKRCKTCQRERFAQTQASRSCHSKVVPNNENPPETCQVIYLKSNNPENRLGYWREPTTHADVEFSRLLVRFARLFQQNL